MNLNEFAREVYDHNVGVGWWDKGLECPYEKLQLASTEVAEATEGERKDLMDDHLPHRKMGEVELADTLIRVLDLMQHSSCRINERHRYRDPWVKLNASIGQLHLAINRQIIRCAETPCDGGFTVLVNTILAVGNILGYEIMDAAREKFEYNKTRADHKRENRAKTGGKKF